MHMICCDLEGVFTPEVWIRLAVKTGIDQLKLTTREVSDYDLLMNNRIDILDKNNLKLNDIKDVIATIDPLEGALEFLNWMRSCAQVIIVSDTFYQFADPLMKKLGYPTLFCNSLVIGDNGAVTGYRLRQKDGKRQVVRSLKGLNFTITAIGDSYNDVTMLQEADHGILFNPSEKVRHDFPDFPVAYQYKDLKIIVQHILESR